MRAERIEALIDTIGDGLYEKDEAIRMALLTVLSGENLFLWGPTGVAKSLVARRIAEAIEHSAVFEYHIGPYTAPEEVLGPISITRLRDDDVYERRTHGYLPESDLAILDGVWSASGEIMSAIQAIIGRRRFRNGDREIEVPLRSVIGSAQAPPPDDDIFTSLWDRFLVRLEMTCLTTREGFTALVEEADATLPPIPPEQRVAPDEVDEWIDATSDVEVPDHIVDLLYDIRESIDRHNAMNVEPGGRRIEISDRRWARAVHLLRMCAYLNDRDQVDAVDCAALRHILWPNPGAAATTNAIIDQALARYAASGRFDPEPLADEIELLFAEIDDACHVEETSVDAAPVEYRAEYVRLVDFEDELTALIWATDFADLESDRDSTIDVFLFDGEEFSHSESVVARRADEFTVRIDDESFEIETHEIERSHRRPVEPDDATRAALRTRLRALRERAEELERDIAAYHSSVTVAAREHLFVPRDAIDSLAVTLAKTRARAAHLAARLDDMVHLLG